MFLSAAELLELTGYKRHADQRRWLTVRHWVFETAATGRPVVAKSYAEARIGAATTAPMVPAPWAPNIAAIRKAA